MLDQSGTNTTHRRRGAEKRTAEIIDAALKLFSERGFANTRLEDVAEAAGVSKATIYIYFESKEDLFYALIREKVVPHVERTEQIITQHHGSYADLLRHIIISVGTMMAAPPLGPAIRLLISEGVTFPDVGQFYREQVIERGLANLAAVIQKAIDAGEFRPCEPKVVSTLVIFPLLMHGIWHQTPAPHDWMTSQAFLGAHADTLLRGLAKT